MSTSALAISKCTRLPDIVTVYHYDSKVEPALRQPPVDQFLLTFIGRWLLYRGSHCDVFTLFGSREAGCFREVVA